ncbi:DUF2019 domain-containing protein [Sphingobacterium sp. DN00404]|uniref:DUF2019 domain-containing protein n=1 Tax=Sphingobacterium micropteri TaxID=2763501 RepID=A0ABR7YN00_9SPHI|nr:DUF2019 domain-containing protein [Sphingobacterium micropteri]MBD1432692.1 DUF2019 domain-containing protein [Sphingobacterium micropteri]
METMITKEKIKEEFLINAIEHGEAYSNGNYKKANKLHAKLHDLYNYAKKWNQVEVFSELLQDKNESVRLWSAIFTLKFNPEVAEKILIGLKKESGVKMTAETTLQLWKEDKLDLL